MPTVLLILGVACVAPVLAWAVWWRPIVRLWAILLTGLLGLDSGPGGAAFKALLIGVLTISMLAPVNWKEVKRRSIHMKGLAVGALVVVMAGGLAQVLIRGAGLGDWLNDASKYAILVACVVACYRMRLTERAMVWLLWTLTPIASVAFALTWLSRRGLAVVDQFYVLGSKALLLALMSIAFTRGMAGSGTRAFGWLFLSALPVVAILISGTRSGILLAAPLVVMSFYGSRNRPSSMVKLVLVSVVIAAMTFWASAGGLLLGDSARDLFAVQRLADSYYLFLEGGVDDTLVSGRLTVASDAGLTFLESPVFGQGFGHVRGVDSTLITLAKFGIAGTLLLLVGVGALLRGLWLDDERIESRGAVLGLVVGLLSLSLSAAIFEDPGLGLALGLLVAATLGTLPIHQGGPGGGGVMWRRSARRSSRHRHGRRWDGHRVG